MAIDARIASVTLATEDGKPVVRLGLEPSGPGAIAGQSALTIVNPPDRPFGELCALIGVQIWGSSSDIMIGETRWARRIGYTRIELLGAERKGGE